MGMAASQARYLALVARKSNCEYEGQQINQARLVLANQSANLFNQMLGLTVPVPPSTQDFTKTQYSFSDGSHSFVIDNWRQLPATDTQYNYIVNTHYFTDVYTGSMKRMADPQVQLGGIASQGIAPVTQIQAMRTALRVAEEVMNTKYAFWQSTRSQQEAAIAALKAEARDDLGYDFVSEISECTHANGRYTLTGTDTTYIINDYEQLAGGEADAIIDELKRLVDLDVISLSQINSAMLDISGGAFTPITDPSQMDDDTIRDQLLQTYGLANYNDTNSFLVKRRDITDIDDNINVNHEIGYFSAYQIASDAQDYHNSIYYATEIAHCNEIIGEAKDAYDEVKDIYEQRLEAYNNLVQPTYIGNSPLTYLDQLSDEQMVELQQVVRDMIAQGIDTDIIHCFNEQGEYTGGVYSFTLYGTTYYTTYNNLLDAYASNSQSNNYIDAQYRMPYYNASYVNTRVDQESRALLETDGNGRFTSIRFENDSVTYSLNMETVTDDVAYQDAMNQYYYENAKYDKMVQDINAKTSIIQKEDQELELRLKQLDTEQNALSNEIDAVSKVVKDNVESSFKTFGG